MRVDPRAGKPATPDMLVNVPRLITEYYSRTPDPSVPAQRVSFGTSGHRGSSLDCAFNESHILAITQAICEYRARQGTAGPLYLGADTHALSTSAWASALEVLAANAVQVRIGSHYGYTPTPVVSHAILGYNNGGHRDRADGIVITPSHNPPRDGGFKYNPPHGGPADTSVTGWVQDRANALLADGNKAVKRIPFERARRASTTRPHDYMDAYIPDLASVVDMDAIRHADLRLGVDPLGGAGVAYWGRIAEHFGLPLTVVSEEVDPTFRFMTVDWDGQIRMDCSSPYAMQRLISLKTQFDVAWACDTDHDRHGIVTGSAGLLNPNHYLAAAIEYLFAHRPAWPASAGVGKTLVSTSMIDRVTARLGRRLVEVPVGFKWFVPGLIDGALAFGGEESAGASLLRRDGTVWTTDKDGIALGLLAAEMTAVSGRDPGALYGELAGTFGDFAYAREDAPADADERQVLLGLTPAAITEQSVAGDPITGRLTTAPGNGAPIGGVKVVTERGWFAVRPSGTEDVYKLYAESFVGPAHLGRIQEEASVIVRRLFATGRIAES
ncbi:MAG: phosphoglucomutase (alpha-D-glucose-1,6-bisphosphate-dependent) [Gemmatimonadota bacterium]